MRQTRKKQKINTEISKVQDFYVDRFRCTIFGQATENNSVQLELCKIVNDIGSK